MTGTICKPERSNQMIVQFFGSFRLKIVPLVGTFLRWVRSLGRIVRLTGTICQSERSNQLGSFLQWDRFIGRIVKVAGTVTWWDRSVGGIVPSVGRNDPLVGMFCQSERCLQLDHCYQPNSSIVGTIQRSGRSRSWIVPSSDRSSGCARLVQKLRRSRYTGAYSLLRVRQIISIGPLVLISQSPA